MRNIIVISLAIILSSAIAADPSQAMETATAVKQERERQTTAGAIPADKQADPNAARPNGINGAISQTVGVLVIDTSKSVGTYWKEITKTAKQIVQVSPENALVGIIGIDAEAI